jgi:hypothetical protein
MIKNNYSPCDETVRARIHERFNVDSDGIKRDIEIIREWIRQQSHLPQDIQGKTTLIVAKNLTKLAQMTTSWRSACSGTSFGWSTQRKSWKSTTA